MVGACRKPRVRSALYGCHVRTTFERTLAVTMRLAAGPANRSPGAFQALLTGLGVR